MIGLDFAPSGNNTIKEEMSCNSDTPRQQEQTDDIDLLLILTLLKIGEDFQYSNSLEWWEGRLWQGQP